MCVASPPDVEEDSYVCVNVKSVHGSPNSGGESTCKFEDIEIIRDFPYKRGRNAYMCVRE